MKKVFLVLFCVWGVFAQDAKNLQYKHFVIAEYEIAPCYSDQPDRPEKQTSVRCGSFLDGFWGSSFKPFIGFKSEAVRPGSRLTKEEKKYFTDYLSDVSKGRHPFKPLAYVRSPVLNKKTNVLAILPVEYKTNVKSEDISHGFIFAPLVKGLTAATGGSATGNTAVGGTVEIFSKIPKASAGSVGGGWVVVGLGGLTFVGDAVATASSRINPWQIEKYGRKLTTHTQHVISVPVNYDEEMQLVDSQISGILDRSLLPKNDIIEGGRDIFEELSDALSYPLEHLDFLILQKEMCEAGHSSLGDKICKMIIEMVELFATYSTADLSVEELETLWGIWFEKSVIFFDEWTLDFYKRKLNTGLQMTDVMSPKDNPKLKISISDRSAFDAYEFLPKKFKVTSSGISYEKGIHEVLQLEKRK